LRKLLEETDVTVVGGGILGLSTAYHLAKSGWNVALVEMDKIAACASGSNAGLIRKGDPVDPTDALIYGGSYKMYQGWNESGELGCDIELNEISVLRCLTDEHVERMQYGLWKRRRLVWEKEGLHPVKRGEWSISEPHVAEDITWGIETSSATINIFRVCRGLAYASEKHGAKIFPYTKVKDIGVKSGRVWTVVTDRGDIETDFVVNAAGAWAPLIGRMVGIEIPILPAIGTALVTEPTPPITRHRRLLYEPVWFNPDQPFAASSTDPCQRLGVTTEIDRHIKEDNYVIARSEHVVNLSLKGAKTRTEPETLKHIAASAIKVLPKLGDIQIIRAYAGMRPVCEVDGKPILGEVEDVDGFIMAAGPWHTGMSYGPMCGKLVSEIIEGKSTSIPIEELNYSRFVRLHHFPYVHQFRWT
jgi:glycine/D-amino acid oxidase-like deaminating enzyme